MSTTPTKVATVMVPTADQDAAVEFYTGRLGLETRVDVPFGPGERWIEVAPEGAETTIAIAPPGPSKKTGGKDTGISLYTDDIDGLHAELLRAGVDADAEISRFDDGTVPPMFWLRDPEANVLMVVGAM